MTGLRPLAAGSVHLFGTDLTDFRDWHRIGFVPQRSTAATGVPASVWEVVASGRLTRRRWLRPLLGADRAAIRNALEVVGLADRARDGVTALSGGQQQRVLIARALAGEPELLFLDEPAAGVDLPNQEALARALGVLKERGATIVLVAHELGPLAPLVDRAVVMRDGRVAYDGQPLADDAVHHPLFLESHSHHHHPPSRHDHAPHVAAPLDATATASEVSDEHPQLRLHDPGDGRRGVHRPGRARGRHLPRAAPAGADGRRHRPRRGHRCRARPAHRHLPHLDRGRRGDPRRGADRGDPRAGPRQRRRRAGAAVLRRHRRRRADHRHRRAERRHAAGLPLRLDHHDLGRATSGSPWASPRWS